MTQSGLSRLFVRLQVIIHGSGIVRIPGFQSINLHYAPVSENNRSYSDSMLRGETGRLLDMLGTLD